MTIYVDILLQTTNLCSQISAWWMIASFRTLYLFILFYLLIMTSYMCTQE